MNTLADAVIAAIIYISTALGDDVREDEDVRALEFLTSILRQCSPPEREALRVALERSRSDPKLLPHASDAMLSTYRAIEADILDI